MRIAWRMLWQRPASMVATFVALWFAVAMVTTCGLMLESGIRYHGSAQRYAAAPILVATTNVQTSTGSGDDRDVETYPLAEQGQLAASLTSTIAEVPGVRAAIGDMAVPSQILSGGVPTPVEVHPWSAARLAPFTLRTGAAPGSDDEVVLDQRLAASIGARFGRTVRLGLASGVRTFTVGGIVAPAGAAPDVPTVFVDDAEATVLSGHPGTVRAIGVIPDRGVDTSALAGAVRAVLPPKPANLSGAYPQVFVGADRGSVESPDVDNGRLFLISVSGVFGGVTLLIAVLVIAGTVGLSVRQRHRDIALLRAIAATPRQVRRMVVRESAALGVLAAAAAVWPGIAGAKWLRDQFVSRQMVPGTFHTYLSWLPPAVAAAAAMLVALVAAWIASLRASRIRPTEALAETAVERGGLGLVRAVLGVIALAGGVTLCFVAASVNGDGAAGISVATVCTLVIAVALLSPLLIRAVAATFGRALAVFGVTGRLAIANVATSARPLAAVVSSLVLAVALGGSLWFVQTTEEHDAAGQSRAGVLAGYVVKPASPGLSPDVTAAIRRTGGVVAATGVARSTLFSPHEGISDYSAEGVDTDGLAHTIDLGVRAGDIADLHGDTIALDTLTASALNLRVGGRFDGWFGDGAPASLRVVAIYGRGLGFAQMTVPSDVLTAHTASGRDDEVFVTTAPGRPGTETALRTELAYLAPGSSLLASGAYQTGLDKDLVQNAWANQMITGVLLVYVMIAAVNTLIMSALARRREFAVLRLSGTTRLQVLRMVRLEQVFLLGLALLVGTAIAAGTLLPMVKGITGSAAPYIPLAGWVAVIGGVVLLGGASTVIPVRRVLTTRPVEAIGIRE